MGVGEGEATEEPLAQHSSPFVLHSTESVWLQSAVPQSLTVLEHPLGLNTHFQGLETGHQESVTVWGKIIWIFKAQKVSNMNNSAYILGQFLSFNFCQ